MCFYQNEKKRQLLLSFHKRNEKVDAVQQCGSSLLLSSLPVGMFIKVPNLNHLHVFLVGKSQVFLS